ncbi:MAG: Tol-Pal system beta propeller repeat protein TolB [Deltaproteobacteria bacterium RIFCSPLOWO2_02_FULL_44_10]|nr:MAG: Tol-Pal system beta propeller repeat protein TolB [Deltaproteobacteria bacterium RIFCSPHIGHO2_02_FULL_44_16]OGQ45625.1 MAG: Tol-Pal system beta propeller repeat protein TolB [Deltaproteobacteria bacterium RIFCSPLOWO2_02_FULL_44_10]
MKEFLLFISIFFFSLQLASARIYIPVDQSSDKKFPIAVVDLFGGEEGAEIGKIIRNDLELSGYFNVLEPGLFENSAEQEGTTLETIQFGFWRSLETQALVKGSIEKERGEFIITLRLFDPFGPVMLVGKQYVGKKENLRDIAHRFSDEIMEVLTGIRGVFTTHIAYVASKGKKSLEVSVMDMDGKRARRLTKNGVMNISPAWSSDGSHLVFTSYITGAPEIFSMRSNGREMTRLTKDPGAKLTPLYTPSGSEIIYISTESGEAELSIMDANGKNQRRLNTGFGIDISPDISPDATEIVFASERSGNLHLFKMNTDGSNVKRLTFVGYQNDMPSWSPRADKIAFAGRDKGTFDIFIMNPDGSNIQRLTIRAGSNEHPTFSPDGRFIVFSSTRSGSEQIYLMRTDGSNQMPITTSGGRLPAWSPRLE